MADKKKYDGVAELSLDDLDGASGGYIYSNGDDPEYPYELIDDKTGDVLAYFARKQDAIESARLDNISTREITWEQLKTLRELNGTY